jgi:hypothetical protein
MTTLKSFLPLAAVVLFGLAAPHIALGASPQIIKVFLQGGQSNSDGRALTNGLPGGLLAPQNDVAIYYYLNGGATNGDGTLGTLTTLRCGLSALGGGTTFGPELTCGRTLADYYSASNQVSTNVVMVAIIKYAVGGTSLAVDWFPNGSATTNGEGPRYLTFQKVVSNGLAKLAATYPGSSIELGGMIWVQGESDIGLKNTNNACAAYGTNLVRFIQDVRVTFGGYPPHGTNFPFLFTRISTNQTVYSNPADADYPWYLLVRAGQAYAATNATRAFMLDLDGPQYSTLTPFSSPGLHFDVGGMTNIGKTFGRALLQTLSATSLAASPQASGEIVIGLSGVSATANTVERAPTPMGPWVPATNLVLDTNGEATFYDSGTNAPGMFYRSFRP